MTVCVEFFASLAEQVGQTRIELECPHAVSARAFWDLATDRQLLPADTLVAINQEYADMAQTVEDGDELAFFPPVTGG